VQAYDRWLVTGAEGRSAAERQAAVAGLVKSLALDLAPRRITVNNVQTGPTATDIHDDAAGTAMAASQPLKRIGEPEEIAGLVAYIASAEAGYVTGSSVTVDGGYVL
jgi:3-oxoacyl-[acyl-carrier protein] reductase